MPKKKIITRQCTVDVSNVIKGADMNEDGHLTRSEKKISDALEKQGIDIKNAIESDDKGHEGVVTRASPKRKSPRRARKPRRGLRKTITKSPSRRSKRIAALVRAQKKQAKK